MSERIQQNTYPRYLQYKDSGVEWLGEIPAGWEVKKVFYFFYAKKGNNSALLTQEYCGSIVGKYPVYSGQTKDEGVMAKINDYEFDFGERGCLFTTTVGAKAMTVKYISGKFSLSQNCMIIVMRKKSCIKFFYYVFQPMFSYYRKLIPDHMQASFRMEDLYQYCFLLPPLAEQKAIAGFLDEKVGKIDRAIELKEQLIERLHERKQIIIQNAVTQGLNPKVPMKDSGIEWIGQIPEHWEVKRLKYLANNKNDKKNTTGTGLQYYGMENVESWTGRIVGEKITADGLANSFSMGDVLFGKLRPYLAKGYLAKKAGICSTEFMIFSCKPQFFNEYLLKIMLSSNFIQHINSSTYGSKMPRANPDFVKNSFIPYPPKEEQVKIATAINELSSKIETAINQAEQTIEKLKEYKATLINASVTGKIKVTDETHLINPPA